jgi:hypothetical protein
VTPAHDRLGAKIAAGARPILNDECLTSRSDSHCPIRRATMSVPPPGPKGTISRTGRDG